jgi:diguanylate cyclase (GGDEF)-like protein
MAENLERQKSPDTTDKLFSKKVPQELTKLQNIIISIKESNAPNKVDKQLLSAIDLAEKLEIITLSLGKEVLNKKIAELKNSLINYKPSSNTKKNIEYLENIINEFKNIKSSPEKYIELNKIEDEITIKNKILIGVKESKLAKEISKHLDYFGYETIHYNTLSEILNNANKLYKTLDLSILILDTDFFENLSTDELKNLPKDIPVLYLSQNKDIKTRLFTVRAGGAGFITLPIEYSTLLEKIDILTAPKDKTPPYRVLIVEDSKTQASFTKETLETAGMSTRVLTNPLDIDNVLLNFRPELILMDLYMPKCSGVELAKVIRQQESFVSVPIVFLSAEQDMGKQLDAMNLGGDDFLTKPIEPFHLISAVTARARRSRELRAEMIQDSLTNLLNHTRILEQLDLEISRAQRERTPLSFVMLDIDNFKAINDTYGHPVGDRVIKSLARFLKQRLRKTDSIGRYGGEEFAIILPGSEAKVVAEHINTIREKFSKIVFNDPEHSSKFNVSFSGGVANLSKEVNTLDKLVETADKVLYKAKNQGRNIVLSEEEL